MPVRASISTMVRRSTAGHMKHVGDAVGLEHVGEDNGTCCHVVTSKIGGTGRGDGAVGFADPHLDGHLVVRRPR